MITCSVMKKFIFNYSAFSVFWSDLSRSCVQQTAVLNRPCPGTREDFTRGPVTGTVPGTLMRPRASRAGSNRAHIVCAEGGRDA